MSDNDITDGALEPSAGASPMDDMVDDVAKSLPGAGRLHDGAGNEATDIEDDDESGEDEVRPSGGAPLP